MKNYKISTSIDSGNSFRFVSFFSDSRGPEVEISGISRKYNDLFTFKGRLPRRPYIFLIIICILLLILNYFVIYALLNLDLQAEVPFLQTEIMLDLTGLIFFIIFILYLIFWVTITIYVTCQSIRRLHDLNLSGFWILLRVFWILGQINIIFIIIAFLFELILLLKKGSSGMNRYGL
ncbi:MAG: DUF805 domain-containing protein [Methanosarcinales archaeon]|jgi:uncharacterized membrane protein YhaH (DUF805 family)|nr:DUF805 domain-containing protein [Methanosarcinales archaeon]